jgi:hypothetical protein
MDKTLSLYRRNFALFAGVVAVVAIPQAILAGLMIALANTLLGAITTALFILTTLFYIVLIGALARVISCRYLRDQVAVASASRSIGGLLSAVVSTSSLPFLLGAITLLYYDLRVRKEGYDLELLARDLSLRPPA